LSRRYAVAVSEILQVTVAGLTLDLKEGLDAIRVWIVAM
jgi:hypothetical protein